MPEGGQGMREMCFQKRHTRKRDNQNNRQQTKSFLSGKKDSGTNVVWEVA